MSLLFDYLAQATVVCFLIGVVAAILRGQSRGLAPALTIGFTGSTIPTGVALIVCAFNVTLVARLSELHLYLAVAGVTVLWLAVSELKQLF